jgi:hypothetical protein
MPHAWIDADGAMRLGGYCDLGDALARGGRRAAPDEH